MLPGGMAFDQRRRDLDQPARAAGYARRCRASCPSARRRCRPRPARRRDTCCSGTARSPRRLANFGVAGNAPALVARGPAAESQAIAAHAERRHAPVHHGIALPSWRSLKKWRMTGPMREHDGDDQPVVAGGKEQRIVVADHQEDDRQRQIIVVDRALLADLAQSGIGRPCRRAARRRSSSGWE